MHTEIYMDANATTAVLAQAAHQAQHTMRALFGNPSSAHCSGLQARRLLDQARARAARLLGTGAGRLMFVSGATEGIQTAVLSGLCAARERRDSGHTGADLLLYGATEHKAVPESLAHWNQVLGLRLQLRAIPVDRRGLHDLQALRAMAPQAAMVCTMAANNETGVVSDLAGIEAALQHSTACWLVDCVQALGKLRLNLSATRIDYAAFSGHKLYAPKGTGLLYVRDGAPFTPLLAGGGQEQGNRSGTENMAGIAALASVLEALEDGYSFRQPAALAAFRDRLADSLRAAFPGLVFNTPFGHALPTTLNFSVPGFSSKEMLDLFDAAGVRVSAGSACSAARAQPSYVLEAMGLPAWQTESAVRMSFGPAADETFIDAACQRIANCGGALRSSGLLPPGAAIAPADGVFQLHCGDACSWLIADAASRCCIVIDPLADLLDRLVATIEGHDYQVLAVLGTRAGLAPVRAALALRLGARLQTSDPSCDGAGWPNAAAADAALADGTRVATLRLGPRWIARLPHAAANVYLLGVCVGDAVDTSAVQFAFTGHEAGTLPVDPTLAHRLAPVLQPRTLLCPALDPQGMIAASLDAAQPGDAEAHAMELAPNEIDGFLLAHPGTLLVDVREDFEFLASPPRSWEGPQSVNVPMGRLADQIARWRLAEPGALVFVCRSGNRSERAAACLRRLGHAQAWHMGGGLAMAG